MSVLKALEALLFVAETPATAEELATAIGVPIFEVEDSLEKLGGRLTHTSSLQLVRIAGGYQICTKPEYADIVTKFLQPQKHKLSRSLMEVLAIVAYKQPVTMSEIDEVRGVQSDYGLKQLVEKRLVCELGRKAAPGRPVLYGTTQQFLHVFNLESLADLPDLGFGRAALDAVGTHLPPDQPTLPLPEETTV
ncbi:MAG: SMC-Scp complex subunit ScpB [Armatimonadetes bacterium]|nr:SMC-Scp complex subunit ScpB [Armatimonadota bacterium]